jgi:hypothetical protein
MTTVPSTPEKRLASLRSERRRIIAESMVMLSYVARRQPATKTAIARLVRGIDRHDKQSLGLPRLILRYPVLLRGLEPIRPHRGHRLAQRLHLAAMVMESMHEQDRPSRPSFGSLVGQSLLELIALAFRVMLGPLYS